MNELSKYKKMKQKLLSICYTSNGIDYYTYRNFNGKKDIILYDILSGEFDLKIYGTETEISIKTNIYMFPKNYKKNIYFINEVKKIWTKFNNIKNIEYKDKLIKNELNKIKILEDFI